MAGMGQSQYAAVTHTCTVSIATFLGRQIMIVLCYNHFICFFRAVESPLPTFELVRTIHAAERFARQHPDCISPRIHSSYNYCTVLYCTVQYVIYIIRCNTITLSLASFSWFFGRSTPPPSKLCPQGIIEHSATS